MQKLWENIHWGFCFLHKPKKIPLALYKTQQFQNNKPLVSMLVPGTVLGIREAVLFEWISTAFLEERMPISHYPPHGNFWFCNASWGHSPNSEKYHERVQKYFRA